MKPLFLVGDLSSVKKVLVSCERRKIARVDLLFLNSMLVKCQRKF
jgi:hypothetical protein